MSESRPGPKSKAHDEQPVSHVERILSLLSLLQSGWFSQEELFQHFPHVSKRTFYRDMEDIRSFFGEMIQTDSQKKLHFNSNSDINFQSLNLSYLELLSLCLVCQLGLDRPNRIPYLTHLESVLRKICHLSKNLVEPSSRISKLSTGMEVGPTSSGAGSRWLRRLLEAQEKKIEVLVRYDSVFDGHPIQTSLAPFYLHFNRRAWYVTGRSGYHHEIRTFNMERFLSVEPLPERPFFIPAGWSYERYRGNAWNMIREAEDADIHLRFSSLVARNVSEVQWHRTQKVRQNSDGTLDMYLTVSGFSEIVWWILGYGNEVEVLSPPELRGLVRSRAEKLLALYSPPSVPGEKGDRVI